MFIWCMVLVLYYIAWFTRSRCTEMGVPQVIFYAFSVKAAQMP